MQLYFSKRVFDNLGGILIKTMAFYSFNHSIFMQSYWFWPKNPIWGLLYHLYWHPLRNHKSARWQTNKQYLSNLELLKVSYYYRCLLMLIWKKILILKVEKTHFFNFPLNRPFSRLRWVWHNYKKMSLNRDLCSGKLHTFLCPFI